MMRIRGALDTLTGKTNVLALVLVVGLGSVFSTLIPPFQSPDEPDHIKRAYLLMKGQILIESRPDQSAGGRIDTGLLAYFDAFKRFHAHPEKKLSKEEELSVAAVRWTGVRVFSPAPGAGYYFPLAYLPQALALAVGKKLGLTVGSSYRLARFFVLTFSVVTIAAAFAVFPTNAFVLGLLIIPISIFQFASASLDGFTTALTVLCMSLFMRGCIRRYSFPDWMSYALTFCILILATSRLHLLPLVVLPIFVWKVRKNTALLWQFALVSLFSLAWVAIAIKGSYVNRVATNLSTTQMLVFYAKRPLLFAAALSNTLDDPLYTGFYKRSFIGFLGWLDTNFTEAFYNLALVLLLLLAAFSVSWKNFRDEWEPRIALIVLASVASLLVFLAHLVTWSALPAKVIEGVQGRYFITPLFMVGYALAGSAGFFEGAWKRVVTVPLLLLLGGMVAFTMPRVLIERYFMTKWETVEIPRTMQPSAPLREHSAIPIFMTERHRDEQIGLKRLGVMFGTYVRRNPGEAELRLSGPDGKLVVPFALPDLADNKYRFFDIDSKRYWTGEVRSVSGGGVSTWESHDKKGAIDTCIIYEYSNGAKDLTPGCPEF